MASPTFKDGLPRRPVRVQIDLTLWVSEQLALDPRQLKRVVNESALKAFGNRKGHLHRVKYLNENGAAWLEGLQPGQLQAPEFGPEVLP